MIKHIVFFNLAENAEAKSKAENAAYIGKVKTDRACVDYEV